jgi:hypothetical protein
MDCSLSIEFVCIYSRQEMFLILNLEYNHISIRFRYNSYAMIGNDFDEVNCYGLLCYMTFKEQEYNSNRFQCDFVSLETLIFIKPVQTRPNHGMDLIHNNYAKPEPVNSY